VGRGSRGERAATALLGGGAPRKRGERSAWTAGTREATETCFWEGGAADQRSFLRLIKAATKTFPNGCVIVTNQFLTRSRLANLK
jgi:hypothetical protein